MTAKEVIADMMRVAERQPTITCERLRGWCSRLADSLPPESPAPTAVEVIDFLEAMKKESVHHHDFEVASCCRKVADRLKATLGRPWNVDELLDAESPAPSGPAEQGVDYKWAWEALHTKAALRDYMTTIAWMDELVPPSPPVAEEPAKQKPEEPPVTLWALADKGSSRYGWMIRTADGWHGDGYFRRSEQLRRVDRRYSTPAALAMYDADLSAAKP